MRTFAAIHLAVLIAALGSRTASPAPPVGGRPASVILAELDRLGLPAYEASRKDDAAYVTQFLVELRRTTEVRAGLILALYQADPGHERIPTLMAERWSLRPYGLPADRLDAEVDEVLARSSNPQVRVEAIFARALSRLNDWPRDRPFDSPVVDEFLKVAPRDDRGARLLQMAAGRSKDEKARTALEDRIIAGYPETAIARRLRGIRHRGDGIGQPFHLEFTDAIGGAPVAIEKFRGKVVVIDFWATWCAPCLAEMPEMKRLYAKYHGQGVEFVGVSLDRPEGEGGLDRLRKYVRENGIAWPQYYQGDGWDSRFSGSRGIRSIPAVFLIDAEGRLASTEAHGKLDELIPAQLKQAARAGGGSGPRD